VIAACLLHPYSIIRYSVVLVIFREIHSCCVIKNVVRGAAGVVIIKAELFSLDRPESYSGINAGEIIKEFGYEDFKNRLS